MIGYNLYLQLTNANLVLHKVDLHADLQVMDRRHIMPVWGIKTPQSVSSSSVVNLHPNISDMLDRENWNTITYNTVTEESVSAELSLNSSWKALIHHKTLGIEKEMNCTTGKVSKIVDTVSSQFKEYIHDQLLKLRCKLGT